MKWNHFPSVKTWTYDGDLISMQVKNLGNGKYFGNAPLLHLQKDFRADNDDCAITYFTAIVMARAEMIKKEVRKSNSFNNKIKPE